MEITLKKGENTAVVTTKGGELASFRSGGGTEFIWQGDPAYWTGRNPVLFPIVGNLKNGKVDIGGKAYEMGRHGFARQGEFSVAERGEDFVTLELRESGDTLARYPCPFLLRVTHRLEEKGFSTSFEVKNTGTELMPFCIGAHTGINCPLYPGEKFEDYDLIFDQVEDARVIPITADGLISGRPGRKLLDHTATLPLSYPLFEELATVIFEGLRSAGVSLKNRNTGRGVHMSFPDWPLIAFWTPRTGAPFVCLEPWNGCAALEDESGEFEDKPCCITLEPEESADFRYAVTVL